MPSRIWQWAPLGLQQTLLVVKQPRVRGLAAILLAVEALIKLKLKVVLAQELDLALEDLVVAHSMQMQLISRNNVLIYSLDGLDKIYISLYHFHQLVVF